MRLKRKSYIRGFTLIELLVVMAVMSILVGVGINTFSIAQKKARDAKRKADLRTLQTALAAYAVNNNSLYPNTGVGAWANVSTLSTYLTSTYIPSLPQDPRNNTTGCWPWDSGGSQTCRTYGYYVCPGAVAYYLGAHLEDQNDPLAGKTATNPNCSDAAMTDWMFVTNE